MDTFDALTSSRDYRERLSVDAARTLIARSAGTKYCPWVVSGLLALPAEMLQQGTGTSSDEVRLPEGRASLPVSALAAFQRSEIGALHASLC
jgi:HD-GYP domain-containing protein (c-di-GMP phosphodiesterase class II)